MDYKPSHVLGSCLFVVVDQGIALVGFEGYFGRVADN